LSELARKLDLLMPDGLWYRTVEEFSDNAYMLEPLFGGSGAFLACNGDTSARGPLGETLVRATAVQAMRWVND
jgi:hypothetical protein